MQGTCVAHSDLVVVVNDVEWDIDGALFEEYHLAAVVAVAATGVPSGVRAVSHAVHHRATHPEVGEGTKYKETREKRRSKRDLG